MLRRYWFPKETPLALVSIAILAVLIVVAGREEYFGEDELLCGLDSGGLVGMRPGRSNVNQSDRWTYEGAMGCRPKRER